MADAAWQRLVCGLQYHVWRVGTENSNFIEKMVSRRTEKSSTLNAFHRTFHVAPSINNSEQAAEAEGQKSVCGLRYHVWHAGT